MATKKGKLESLNLEFEKPENLRGLARKMPDLKTGYSGLVLTLPATPTLPNPPLFGLGPAFEPILEAARLYLEFIFRWGAPPQSWAEFERSLAFNFAFLLRFLAGLDRKKDRVELLEVFLKSLKLKGKQGRPLKAKEELMSIMHGSAMWQLWVTELREPWNLAESLEKQGKNPEPLLRKRQFPEDVIREVLRLNATRESATARVYADRKHISGGTARNALRTFLDTPPKRRLT
jgi:hypothetical protein